MKSIIIPAYNAEYHLDNCLEALQNQDYSEDDVEIIVVDDGSTDDTSGTAERRGVRVLHQENRGPATARNLGAIEARGDIILFTDADCVPDPNWVTAMLAPFKNNDVCGVMGRYRTHQGELTAQFAQLEFEDRYMRLQRQERTDFVATYSAAFRRAIFLGEGGFNESYRRADNEDVELSYRLAEKGYHLVFTQAAIVYHLHPATVGAYFRQKLGRAYWRMVTYSFHPQKAIADSYTPMSLKLEILLIGLLTSSLILGLFSSFFLYLSMVIFASFLVLTIEMIVRMYPYNTKVALISPFYLFIRSFAFLLGIILVPFKAVISRMGSRA